MPIITCNMYQKPKYEFENIYDFLTWENWKEKTLYCEMHWPVFPVPVIRSTSMYLQFTEMNFYYLRCRPIDNHCWDRELKDETNRNYWMWRIFHDFLSFSTNFQQSLNKSYILFNHTDCLTKTCTERLSLKNVC